MDPPPVARAKAEKFIAKIESLPSSQRASYIDSNPDGMKAIQDSQMPGLEVRINQYLDAKPASRWMDNARESLTSKQVLVGNSARGRRFVRVALIAIGSGIVSTLLFFANFHVFTTAEGGFIVLRKSHISLMDNVVPMEDVVRSPRDRALRLWPVARLSLEDNGLIAVPNWVRNRPQAARRHLNSEKAP
jgi:hypothetical protein